MTDPVTQFDQGEFARRGQAIFDRDIRPNLRVEDDNRFVAIDIDSDGYEIDRDDYIATERLLARLPNARIWLLRIGQRAAYRIGGRLTPGGKQ